MQHQLKVGMQHQQLKVGMQQECWLSRRLGTRCSAIGFPSRGRRLVGIEALSSYGGIRLNHRVSSGVALVPLASMAKKRNRHENPEPFLPEEVASASSKKRSKAPRSHQKEERMIEPGLSSRIIKEALIQQREIQEEAEERNPDREAFAAAEDELAKLIEEDDDEADFDDFAGFSETQSRFGDFEEEIDEEEERILDAFLSKDASRESTLADVIIQKIKDKDAQIASEARPLPQTDSSLIDIYKGVGQFMGKYTAGKVPIPLRKITTMAHWEDLLNLTEPEKWSPNGVYQATRILASNLNGKEAERFYRLVLLPLIRDDIRKHKRLHFSLYQSLKKSLFKPAAFYEGILLPLCKLGTCSSNERDIIGSVIKKVSIPMRYSSAALLQLAEMEYCDTTTSHFIKILLEKDYALHHRAIDALVAHYMRFMDESRIMPLIWHQSLLAFVQRYKNDVEKEDKEKLRMLVGRQKHHLITPEIVREIDNSRNRGEKEEEEDVVPMINKTIEEDRFDIPEVPMEED
ncbi:ENP1 [Linum perenne]